ncbi:hypothetical protein QQZ08_001319 [Neonectria magnoliae]|uniref:Peptidase S8/S53 domain-containing protein n=1 Tax=Neonectria magnoliae TaxID=2732573 RepID=A0ABR1IFE9_9HYPO
MGLANRPFLSASTRNCGSVRDVAWASLIWTGYFYNDEMLSRAHFHVEVQKYLSWKVKYQAVYKNFIDPYMQDPPLPVKIAVLDSGVDESHNALDTGQMKMKRNWTSKFKKAIHDLEGHGTFTASLIIDYAPDAELYIAKIAEKEPSPPAIVTEAIKVAMDEWGVDIISLSLEYSTNQIDGDLENAILYARSEDVLLFAAASNISRAHHQAGMLKRKSRMKGMFQKIAKNTQKLISRDDYDYIAVSMFSDNLVGKDKRFIDTVMSELLKR